MKGKSIDQGRGARLTPAMLVRRFARERKGSVAIEFILLAPLFFAMLFAILESCIAFAAQEVMTNATESVARQFRTGEIKAGEINAQDLRDKLCDRMSVLFPSGCSALKVDLRTYPTYEDAANEFANGPIPSIYQFSPGGSLDKSVMRVVYHWPVIMRFMIDWLSDEPDGTVVLYAAAAWQNEPY